MEGRVEEVVVLMAKVSGLSPLVDGVWGQNWCGHPGGDVS